MAYCTQKEIIKLLPEELLIQLTDDENLKPAAIDPRAREHRPMRKRISEAISTADAEINGYCAERYSVPFQAPISPIVKGLSVEIAIYYLHARRTTVPEDIIKRYDKAILRLKDIARGLMSLDIDDAPKSDTAYTESQPRLFTREKMRGF